MFRLDENSIDEFKAPLGKLYADFEDAIPKIKEARDHNHDIIRTENILEADNPAGTITENLWETIEEAISLTLKDSENRIIVVKGEEDLAVLPCLLVAPENAVVLYGQPNEGLVFVNVFEGKDKATKLMTYLIEE